MSTPAFQFYPQDFLVGTAEMSPAEVGAYIRLLCYQWSKGGLPNDQQKCAMMAGCDGNAVASIWHKFGICDDGKMRNGRLEQVRAEQDAYRERQGKNASKGWEKRRLAKPPHCDGSATALPTHMPEACSSSSPSLTLSKDRMPPLDDFLDFYLSQMVSYPDFSLRQYLEARYEDWKGVGWKKGARKIEDWTAFLMTLKRDYENDRNKNLMGGDPNAPRKVNGSPAFRGDKLPNNVKIV